MCLKPLSQACHLLPLKCPDLPETMQGIFLSFVYANQAPCNQPLLNWILKSTSENIVVFIQS